MNFLRKHNYGIILALLFISLLSYTIYTGFILYPEYELSQEYSITLKTVLAGVIFAGNAYFLITLPFFHYLFAKLKTPPGKYKQTDYILLLCKVAIFAVWVYISNDIYNSDMYNDNVDKLIIIGIFGLTYIIFDVIYALFGLFVMFTQQFVDSFDYKKKNKKNHKENTVDNIDSNDNHVSNITNVDNVGTGNNVNSVNSVRNND